jgi:hypothetical protein
MESNGASSFCDSDRGNVMTVSEPLMEVFPAEKQVSLSGLTGGRFKSLYEEYKVLLVRLEDNVVVAGARENDRPGLAKFFCEETGAQSLEKYAFEHGPTAFTQVVKGARNFQRG